MIAVLFPGALFLPWPVSAFLFLFGLCFGSLCNAMIYRMPREESLFTRSRCPKCNTTIPFYFNIPLLAYFYLRGKCHQCRANISWRYPVIELLTATLFLLACWRNPGGPLVWMFLAYFVCALVITVVVDLDFRIIPDLVTLPGIGIGFLSTLLIPTISPLQSILGILLGGGLLFLVSYSYLLLAKQEGLGGGDIKYLAMVGAFLGPQGAMMTIVLASILGSAIGIAMILAKRGSGKTAIPFGPFLVLGTLIYYFYGPELWEWYFFGGQASGSSG